MNIPKVTILERSIRQKELNFQIPYVTLNQNGDGFDYHQKGSYFRLTKDSKLVPVELTVHGVPLNQKGADEINYWIFKKLHILHIEGRLYVRSDLFEV